MNVDLNLTKVNYPPLAEGVAAPQTNGVNAAGAAGAATNAAAVTIAPQAGAQAAAGAATPEIDTPASKTGSQNTQELKTLENQLDKTAKELEAQSSQQTATTAATTKGSALFDIYALFSLMIETQQKQKETALLQRQTEHANIQSKMTQEAASIKSAAQTTYASTVAAASVGIAMSATSLVMTVAGGIKQGSAHKTNAEIQNTAGIKADLVAAKADLAAVNKVEVNPAAQQPTVGESLGKLTQDAVGNEPAGAFKGETKVEQAVVKAQATKISVDSKLAQAEKLENEVKTLDGALKGAAENPNIDVNDENAQVQVGNETMTVGQIKEAIATKSSELSQVRGDLKTLQIQQADDLVAVNKAMDEAIAQPGLAEDKKTAMVEAKNAFLQNGEIHAAMKDGLTAKCDGIREKRAAANVAVMQSWGMKQGDAIVNAGNALAQLGNSIASYIRADADQKQSMAQSATKLAEADIEAERAKLDDAKDAVQMCRDMISTLTQTRRDIEQAQSQSVQSILRA